MKLLFTVLICLSSHLFAQSEMDQRLQGYIEKFQLKNLPQPTGMNRDLLNIGRTLFVSPIVSGNNNISCRDCHFPGNMTVDSIPLAIGEGAVGVQSPSTQRNQGKGKILARNSQGLFNLEGIDVLFWDGRISYDRETGAFTTPVAELNGVNPVRADIARTLKSAIAAQAIFPIADHDEMRGAPGSNALADAKTELEAWDLVVKKVLKAFPAIDEAFKRVYPGETINIGHFGNALAEFQRFAFAYSDTPYDSYLRGDLTALNDLQKKGMDVFFNKGKCGECHQGEHLSNFEFHSAGVPQIGPGKQNGDDFGRAQWDASPGNLYAFRVPPLRNVVLTAPFMHNGSIATLSEVIEHYNKAEESLTTFKLLNVWKNYTDVINDHDHSQDDVRLSSLSTKLARNLELSEEEEKALLEFLSTGITDKALISTR